MQSYIKSYIFSIVINAKTNKTKQLLILLNKYSGPVVKVTSGLTALL